MTVSLSSCTQVSAHALMFAGIAAAVLLASSLLGAGSTTFHLLLLLALLPFLGILHGALDYFLAERIFRRRFGRNWVTGFIAMYLLTMALVLMAWSIHPGASLAIFLAVTLYHFGTGDALVAPKSQWPIRAAEVLGRGGAVLTFPAVFDRQQVLVLLSYLAPETEAQMLVQLLAALAPLCGLCLAAVVLWSGICFFRYRTQLDLARGAELTAIGLTFTFLPALLAFTLYFNLLHAVRHMLAVAGGQVERTSGAIWSELLWTAIPVTAITFLIGGMAYYLFSGPTFRTEQLFRVIFIGIASMTYPHMAIVWIAKRSRIFSAQSQANAGAGI